MSQPSLSRCISQVTNAIIFRYFNETFSFPKTSSQRQAASNSFLPYAKFPGVLGCVDCSHITIIRPCQREEAYFNHKGSHSINVQMICNEQLKIINVLCFPGSVHDQFIFASSFVCNEMKRLYEQRIGQYCLLGDSGYMLQPYMMTPIINAIQNSPEDKYTKAHCSTRNRIERVFGVLKSRFRCLSNQRVLHYSPQKASKFVIACSILHNLCVDLRVPPIVNNDDVQLVSDIPADGQRNDVVVAAGRRAREQILQNYFSY